MWLKTLAIFFMLTASVWGQLAVESRSAIQLSGIDQAEQIGSTIFVASDSTVARLPVILITATTEAANITFEVSDRDRIPIDFEQLTEDTIMVSTPGKSWVRIVAIDFEKNLYATKLLPIELGSNPDPDKPDPKPPPDGPFDGLASKVSVVASQMSQRERTELISVLTSAASKLRRFEFKTLEQARQFVESKWTKTEPAEQLQEILARDAQDRLLSWEQAQKYYLEVAKGLN